MPPPPTSTLYTLSLHDALPIFEGRRLDERDADASSPSVVLVDQPWARRFFPGQSAVGKRLKGGGCSTCPWTTADRSEEHTSELQSRLHLVCRLLLEKKNTTTSGPSDTRPSSAAGRFASPSPPPAPLRATCPRTRSPACSTRTRTHIPSSTSTPSSTR